MPEEAIALAELGQVPLRLRRRRRAPNRLGTQANMRTAETANVTASSTSTFVAPRTAISTPASGSSDHVGARETPSNRLVPRSSVIPACSSRSGSIASRAVWPGASRSAPPKTSASRAQNGSPTVWKRIGIAEHRRAAREVGDDARVPEAEPVDDHAAERGGDHERKEREEADEAGLADAAGRLETNQGIAIWVSRLPVIEIALAASRPGDRAVRRADGSVEAPLAGAGGRDG